MITMEFLAENYACSPGQEFFLERLDGKEGLPVPQTFAWLREIGKLDWSRWLLAALLDQPKRARLATYALKLALKELERDHPWDGEARGALNSLRAFVTTGRNFPYEVYDLMKNLAGDDFSDNNTAFSYIVSAAVHLEEILHDEEASFEAAWMAMDDAVCAIISVGSAGAGKAEAMIVNYGLRLLGVRVPKGMGRRT